MSHEFINLIDAPSGSKYLLRFVGDPAPSRGIYVKGEDGELTRFAVRDAVDKLEDAGVKIYREAFAVCLDVHGDGCLTLTLLPEPVVMAVQRFVQAGGSDPGGECSFCFLVEIGTGNPVMMTIHSTKPSDLDPSIYERVAGMKDELYELAKGNPATTAEVLDMFKSGTLVEPYRNEAESWFEPREAVERVKVVYNGPYEDLSAFDAKKLELYEDFITYVAECCDDEDVAMVAGILCRLKGEIK